MNVERERIQLSDLSLPKFQRYSLCNMHASECRYIFIRSHLSSKHPRPSSQLKPPVTMAAIDEQQCAICLMGFKEDEACHWMQCTHKFHLYCCEGLAEVKCAVSKLGCPVCKTPACSDDEILEKLATEHEKALADEMPHQAIEFEDTQEYPPVIDIDLTDTAVRYELIYPGPPAAH